MDTCDAPAMVNKAPHPPKTPEALLGSPRAPSSIPRLFIDW